VVVNDVGGSASGAGSDPSVAASVAEEVGGVADTNDVSDREGAEALVEGTLERFGRLDALVNNAGIIRWAGMPDVDEANLLAHLRVHLVGSLNTTRAAWSHMAERGYGRIVMTTSTGLFGLPDNVSYAAAKAGVIGLTRSLAVAGAPHGIKVNAIAPAARTRMAGPEGDDASVELVAPMAAFLAHDRCPVTGEIYAAGFGRFARIFIASTRGWALEAPTVEDVARHWDAINREAGYYVPADLPSWSTAFLGTGTQP
jgi:NAD(P)-dependent dehydrogenase (short-subunit alcohol dehydrogenase family)